MDETKRHCVGKPKNEKMQNNPAVLCGNVQTGNALVVTNGDSDTAKEKGRCG